MYRGGPVIVGTFLVSALLAVSTPASASGVSLPGYGGGIAVDDANGHVFVSGGSSDTVSVMNVDGTLDTTIALANGTGPEGLAISGSTLYVALNGSAKIDEIDTGTLQETGSIDISGFLNAPMAVAFSSGLLWVSWGGSTDSGGIASVNVSNDATKVYAQPALSWVPQFPWLVASTSLPNRVFFWDTDLLPYHLVEANTSTDPPTLVASSDGGTEGLYTGIRDLALSFDGTKVLTGFDGFVGEYTTSDLTSTGTTYPTEDFDHGVATSASQIAIGTQDYGVLAFDPGNSTATYHNLVDFTATVDHGLAFSGDGLRLFLVSLSGGATDQFRVLFPHQAPTSLTLSVSRLTVNYGQAVTLTAHLAGPQPKVTNRTVTILEEPVGGARRVLASGPVNGKGNLKATVTPRRTTSYLAEYGGDFYDGSSTSRTRSVGVHVDIVGRLFGFDGTSGRYRLYRYTSGCPNHHRGAPLTRPVSPPTTMAGTCSSPCRSTLGVLGTPPSLSGED